MSKNRFIMRWPELAKQVEVCPVEHNQEVFNWFLTNLPTRCIQTETVVAGQSLFMLNLPMSQQCTWIQEELPLEDIVKMNQGRFTFFMTTGNVANLSVKFGLVTEPMSYVTWAEVADKDKATLYEVGQELWDNLMLDKKIVHVEFIGAEA